MSRPSLPFEQLVFSGGGLRCFWHGGFLEAVCETHRLTPSRVTGSSGGALSAATFIAGIERRVFEGMTQAMAREDGNLTVEDLANDNDGRIAHQRIYDEVLEEVFDAPAIARIVAGPAFQISVSTPGDSSVPTLKALVGGAIYQLEQLASPTPRPRLASLSGMEQRLIDARAAAREGLLPKLIRMAATVPPAFRPDTWEGEWIYDGGMVDKAPLPDPDRGRTLVLLTKRFHALPDDAGGRITYVEPSEDILPGAKLDFTDPRHVTEAWNQGLEDGRRWRNKIT